MAHFAKVQNGIVTEVIVADQEFIDSGAVGTPSDWIQTSYNTRGGKHLAGGTPVRKNFAGVGYIYDKERDAFIPPKQYPSWVLNEKTCLFEAPKPAPKDITFVVWDESKQDWREDKK